MQATPTQHWNSTLYQASHAFVWQQAGDLIELVAPQPGERILDVGCGTGQLTQQIADRGAAVTGVDRSLEMIAQARKNFPALQFEVADATAMTFDAPFDAVFSNAALHWIKPPEDAAARLAEAIRPGGRLVLEMGGAGNVAAICEAMRDPLRKIAGIDFDAASPWYFPTVAQYASILERAGFRVTFAALFDRSTPLEGPDGLRNWLRMFGASLFAHAPVHLHDSLLEKIEDNARPQLFRDGQWWADYVRLRMVARKP